MTDTNPEDLVLRFGGKLVEQLGAQMYPSATATVAELISNAWDADAKNVWVDIPFGDWKDGEIVVVDDGAGMGISEARDAYLVVGRNLRQSGGQRTPGLRLVHGRKGIGKLAAFGTASVLELRTRKSHSPEVSFRLDYNRIRTMDPTEPYRVEPSADLTPLVNPVTGATLESGTRIRLSELKLKRRLDPDQFLASMSRRFALDSHEMAVWINGDPLRRFSVDLQFRFPPDRLPPEASGDGDWATERLPDGRVVRWWIGFTPKPIKDDSQGISVLVRGKLAQRPFKFEKGGGTTGQLGQEYLVGEVEADWLDDESDDPSSATDYIQSNRDQLQLEDQDLESFLDWGRQRVRWALAARDEMRRQQEARDLEQNKALEALLRGRPKRERSALNKVAAAIARLPETSDDDVVRVMKAVLNSREDETTQEIAEEIFLADGEPDEIFALLAELAALNNRSSIAFIEARIGALAEIESLNPLEALAHVTELLLHSPGLLNLRWEMARTERSQVDGADVILADSLLLGTAELIVVVAESMTDSATKLARSAALRDPHREVLLLTAQPLAIANAASAKVISWSELVRASIAQHRGWADLVRRRLEANG